MALRTAPRASEYGSSAPTITALSSSHSGETWRFTTGRSSSSPSSFASSSRLPLASLMADRAVRYCLDFSASASMFSVLCWRCCTCSRRLSAVATSDAISAITNFAGKWLALCRRTAASETSYNDATERFDASPTRARSIASLSECAQTVQLRGIVTKLHSRLCWYLPSRHRVPLAQESLRGPHAHRHGKHQVVVLGKPPAFELPLCGLRLEARKLAGEDLGEAEAFGYLQLLGLKEEKSRRDEVAPRHQPPYVGIVGDRPVLPGDGYRALADVGSGILH